MAFAGMLRTITGTSGQSPANADNSDRAMEECLSCDPFWRDDSLGHDTSGESTSRETERPNRSGQILVGLGKHLPAPIPILHLHAPDVGGRDGQVEAGLSSQDLPPGRHAA